MYKRKEKNLLHVSRTCHYRYGSAPTVKNVPLAELRIWTWLHCAQEIQASVSLTSRFKIRTEFESGRKKM